MKVESIGFKMVLIGLLTVALCLTTGGMGLAMVSKTGGDDYCDLCHQSGGGDGKPLKPEYQGSRGCVNCHSSSTSSATYNMTGGGQTVTVPVVNYTGASAPNDCLAGGNFWRVADLHGDDDAKGHNVLGIAGEDGLSEAPGNQYACGNSCHYSLANNSATAGCEGCHLSAAHHANDHPNGQGGLVDSADAGWYRFLSGHMSGSGFGVHGYEDGDWETTKSAADHNEYLGWVGDHGYAAGFYNLGATMTAFCCGCHGNYHIQNPPSARHPSDLVIPNSGPYANAFGAGGSGTGIYEPNIPVARPSLNGTVSPTVTLDTDMVMCLSCHRAHGSPYRKMLRWDIAYTTNPCSKCHTNLEKP